MGIGGRSIGTFFPFWEVSRSVASPTAISSGCIVVDGGCDAVDPTSGAVLDEAARISTLDESDVPGDRKRFLVG